MKVKELIRWLAVPVLAGSLVLGMNATVASGSGEAATTSLLVAAFEQRVTTHYNCEAPSPGEEYDGTLSDASGSFLESVQLPHGATITRFRYSVRDNTTGASHAWLIRKRIKPKSGTSAFGGWQPLADVHSKGRSDAMDRFGTRDIKRPVVDNVRFAYFVEVVNCDPLIQPIGVEVTYLTP